MEMGKDSSAALMIQGGVDAFKTVGYPIWCHTNTSPGNTAAEELEQKDGAIPSQANSKVHRSAEGTAFGLERCGAGTPVADGPLGELI
ncbi:hypothetical protein ACO22_05449 [Paracoccidioides brasiliensis]|uniref:Uncharacterized protein n=1 Tax=Paracoccidioides brasiliensis TaxID=121759 RepID=A0A1D2JAI6_PARBR|nr:hypothetical protein ACO22_05449 [Paracoccidioides brasiliensis]ODH49576.1 hypothetical protein GX48_04363 [Paracoccidioides brasiliensis]